jgi:hypothetical protein
LVLTSQLSAAFRQNEATAGVQMLARFPVPIWRNFPQADFWPGIVAVGQLIRQSYQQRLASPIYRFHSPESPKFFSCGLVSPVTAKGEPSEV